MPDLGLPVELVPFLQALGEPVLLGIQVLPDLLLLVSQLPRVGFEFFGYTKDEGCAGGAETSAGDDGRHSGEEGLGEGLAGDGG